jgi:hypothetical protein
MYESGVSYSHPSDGAYWYCLNTSNTWQYIYSNGGGTFPPDHAYIYEQSLNVTFDNESYCPATPDYPMFMADNFNYIDSVNSCLWSTSPLTPVYTTTNKLCYDTADNGGQAETFSLGGQGNFFTSDVWTEEFNINIKNESSYIEHTLNFAPNNGQDTPAITITFFGGSVAALTGSGSNTTLSSICAGCYAYGVEFPVRISLYSSQSLGYTVLNSSSNAVQAILPETFSIKVNNGNTSFNIPLQADTYTNPHVDSAVFSAYQRGFCLDDYKLYGGFVSTPQQQVNLTGVPFKQLGEYCAVDWECFTGLCNFIHQCVKKPWAVACTNYYECVSGECENGKCTKPTTWESITAVKDENAGDDEPTNNLISIIFALLGAMAFGMVIYKLAGDKAGFAAIASGVTFVLLLGLFALGGWLSPWIMVMLIICIILLIVLMIVLGSGG